MIVGRIIGWIFLLAAVGVFSWDLVAIIITGELTITPLGEIWARIDTASLQLLHDQVRLDAQEQRLTGISITCRSPSLQSFRLEQGLFTELLVAHFEATLRTGLKSSEGRGLDRRGRNA